jgi:hypothetical protein
MKSELGHVARQAGNTPEARKIYHETLNRWHDMGNRGAIANQLESFAFIDILEEEPQQAALLLGGAESLRNRVNAPMTDFERREYDEFVLRLQAMLPVTEFQSLWAQGRSMTIDQAIQLALSETGGSK